MHMFDILECQRQVQCLLEKFNSFDLYMNWIAIFIFACSVGILIMAFVKYKNFEIHEHQLQNMFILFFIINLSNISWWLAYEREAKQYRFITNHNEVKRVVSIINNHKLNITTQSNITWQELQQRVNADWFDDVLTKCSNYDTNCINQITWQTFQTWQRNNVKDIQLRSNQYSQLPQPTAYSIQYSIRPLSASDIMHDWR